ncbi:MAG: hypothetical protein ABSC06_03505 [Rhodopila sp.]
MADTVKPEAARRNVELDEAQLADVAGGTMVVNQIQLTNLVFNSSQGTSPAQGATQDT